MIHGMSIYDLADELKGETDRMNDKTVGAINKLREISDDDTRQEIYETIETVISTLNEINDAIF